MSTQKPSHLDKSSPSLGNIFKDSIKKVPHFILSSYIIIFLCSVLIACVLTFGFSTSFWYLNQLAPEYNLIQAALREDPNYIIPPELQAVKSIYPIFSLLINFIQWSGPFFIILALILFQAGKMYDLYTDEIGAPSTWRKSFRYPFRSWVFAKTAILLLIGGTIIVTLGWVFFIIPGFFLLIFWIFAIFAFIIDDKTGRQCFRGAHFYISNNIKILIILIFCGVFLPLVLSSIYQPPLMNILGLTDAHFIEWLNPANRQWGYIFLYHWVSIQCQTFLFWWFPTVFASAFYQIRDLKLDEYAKKSPHEVA